MLEGVREGDSGVAGAQCNFAGMAPSNRQTMSAVRVARRAERQCRQGRAVQLMMPPMSGTDFNDVLVDRDGRDG